jgi:hypothetical protein
MTSIGSSPPRPDNDAHPRFTTLTEPQGRPSSPPQRPRRRLFGPGSSSSPTVAMTLPWSRSRARPARPATGLGRCSQRLFLPVGVLARLLAEPRYRDRKSMRPAIRSQSTSSASQPLGVCPMGRPAPKPPQSSRPPAGISADWSGAPPAPEPTPRRQCCANKPRTRSSSRDPSRAVAGPRRRT